MSLFSRPSPIRFPDSPAVSLILPDEASLWACGALYEYTSSRISFQTDRFRVTVEGENLTLRAMTANEVLIRGSIHGVKCDEREE